MLQTNVFDKNFFEEIKKYGDIDLAVVVAYGLYIPSYFVSYPKYSCLNIHLSLLPLYRGAAPVARAIMDGNIKTGSSIIKLAKQMDAGDIVASKEIDIDITDTTESLTWNLIKQGINLLLNILPDYFESKIILTPQDSIGIKPTYAQKISRQEAVVNWCDNAMFIHNKIRALHPWPGLICNVQGIDFKILQTKPLMNANIVAEPATIIYIDTANNRMLIQTGNGVLSIEKVQPVGKKPMTINDFVNGYKIKQGNKIL